MLRPLKKIIKLNCFFYCSDPNREFGSGTGEVNCSHCADPEPGKSSDPAHSHFLDPDKNIYLSYEGFKFQYDKTGFILWSFLTKMDSGIGPMGLGVRGGGHRVLLLLVTSQITS